MQADADEVDMAEQVAQHLPLQSDAGMDTEGDGNTALLDTALLLENKFSVKTTPDVTELAKHLGIQRKALWKRLHCVGESADQHQRHQYTALADHIHRLAMGDGCTAVCFLEHSLYDETPLKASLRLPSSGGKHTEIAKLFVIEIAWSMLIRRHRPGLAKIPKVIGQPLLANSDDYLCLRSQYSLQIRVGEGTSGEAVRPILASCPEPPPVATSFAFHTRLTDTDEAGGNKRAEAMLMKTRPSSWTSVQSYCVAHKIHLAAERTWSLKEHEQVISGLLQVALFFQQTGTTKAFRDAMKTVLETRELQTSFTAALPETTTRREHLVKLFAPSPRKHPRRHALVQVMSSTLLNGDWTSNTLVHHCTPNCCLSPRHTRRKVVKYVLKTLVALPSVVWQRGDWAGWRAAAMQCGLLQGMHGLFTSAFQLAFAKVGLQPALNPHANPNDDAGLDGMFQGDVGGDAATSDRYRAENLQHQRHALAFLATRHWHSHLVIMIQALAPQMSLMHAALEGTSVSTEHHQQCLGAERRSYRVVEWHLQTHQNRYLEAALFGMKDTSAWGLQETGDTEALRSLIFASSMRGPAAVFQTITTPLCGFPWKIFSLLNDASLENAASILRTPYCLLDPWSREIVAKYPSEEALSADTDLRQMLLMVAQTLLHTTFTVERAHARNARRSRATAHTWVKSIEALALPHMASSGPPWLSTLSQQASVASKAPRRGRPAKRKEHEPPGEDSLRLKRRRGGGGAWRAFIHHQTKSLGRAVDFAALREQYVDLSPHDREYYRNLGRLGPGLRAR